MLRRSYDMDNCTESVNNESSIDYECNYDHMSLLEVDRSDCHLDGSTSRYSNNSLSSSDDTSSTSSNTNNSSNTSNNEMDASSNSNDIISSWEDIIYGPYGGPVGQRLGQMRNINNQSSNPCIDMNVILDVRSSNNSNENYRDTCLNLSDTIIRNAWSAFEKRRMKVHRL
jgi:hypothetical protein